MKLRTQYGIYKEFRGLLVTKKARRRYLRDVIREWTKDSAWLIIICSWLFVLGTTGLTVLLIITIGR